VGIFFAGIVFVGILFVQVYEIIVGKWPQRGNNGHFEPIETLQ